MENIDALFNFHFFQDTKKHIIFLIVESYYLVHAYCNDLGLTLTDHTIS